MRNRVNTASNNEYAHNPQKAFSSCKIKPNITAKFKNDMIGSMNAELVNTKARMQKLIEDSTAGGGEITKDELMKNSAVTEPLFIISLKKIIYKIIDKKIKILNR